MLIMVAHKTLEFVGKWVVIGLAAAFVVVYLRPDLLAARMPARAADSGPPAVPASASFADAVSVAGPAVVNVYTARLVTEPVRPSELDRLFGDEWPSVRQRVEASLGSGVVVDDTGLVVTNHHVIDGAREIRVQLSDGRVAVPEIVGTDPETDLALMRIGLDDLPVMPLGRSNELRVGDVVLAIGNPLGLTQTVTQGIVSATGRGQIGTATFADFIQTDAAINLGNSGGALVNAHGELVGINTAVLGRTLGTEGIGFAIPVNLVRGVIGQILEYGRVRRGWFGVVPRELPRARAAALGLDPPIGIELADVYRDGPAWRGGLRSGDVITRLNGQPVRTSRDALNRVAGTPPGEPVRVEGIRKDGPFDIEVTVQERPAPPRG
jgi:serine peptidase DegS